MNATALEKRGLGVKDIEEIYGICDKLAQQMIKRIRIVLYPPTSAKEKDNHPLPSGRVYATDLPVFEEKMRALKGRDENEG